MIFTSIYAIAKALLRFAEHEPRSGLRGSTQIHREILEKTAEVEGEVARCFSEKELRAWASENGNYLNKILTDEGFDKFFPEEDDMSPFYGVMSILHLLTKWLSDPEKTKVMFVTEEGTIHHSGETESQPLTVMEEKKAILFRKDFTVIGGAGRPALVQIRTETGDTINICMVDKSLGIVTPHNEFELLTSIDSIERAVMAEPTEHYDRLRIPTISTKVNQKLSWLVGICKTSDSSRIIDAGKQLIFRLDEKGVEVKMAVTLLCCSGYIMGPPPPPPKEFVVNRPFHLWIRRPGCKYPVFAAHVTAKELEKYEVQHHPLNGIKFVDTTRTVSGELPHLNYKDADVLKPMSEEEERKNARDMPTPEDLQNALDEGKKLYDVLKNLYGGGSGGSHHNIFYR